LCPRCGMTQASGILCARCRRIPGVLDGIRSPFRFEEVIRTAIHGLKYKHLKVLSFCLAELLAEYLKLHSIPGEVLVPVPLHPQRLRKRGYNQSLLISRDLGKLIMMPVSDNCLVRVKAAQPQVSTKAVEERWSNVANAFICRDDSVRNKQVILIDDVCTSGATLEACAVALKKQGASSVWGLTLARESYN
jgi:ComF family protein